MQNEVIKGTRWLLLKNPENLDEANATKLQRLQEALRLNEPLATAYYLKEDLCARIWSQTQPKRRAARFLAIWMARASVVGYPNAGPICR